MAWTVPADLERAAGAAGATTSSSPHGHDARHAAAVVQQNHVAHVLHDLLAAFFQAYLVDQADVRKERMSTLLMQADGMGLLGVRSVPALSALFVALEADLGADARRFAAFYHFVFFIARERGHRNLAFGTAVDGWRFLLGNGRFALLEAWCDFVSRRTGDKGVSEDTWCQVLDFAHAVSLAGGGLSGYDPQGAWPVLVDEFVDEFQSDGPRQHVHVNGGNGAVAMDQSSGRGWGEPGNMVYNGGVEGGAGRGLGWRPQRQQHTLASAPLARPTVGCKRRLSAVLEVDGLADHFERQARCHSPSPAPVLGMGGSLQHAGGLWDGGPRVHQTAAMQDQTSAFEASHCAQGTPNTARKLAKLSG